MIRLYAQLSGSFKTVSEGLKEGFEELGVLSGYHVGEHQEFDSDPVPGSTAPVAVVVGDPGRTLMAHTQGQHEEIWLMLAPNSEGIPARFKQELTSKRQGRLTVDGLLAPSTWALDVLRREFPNTPVRLCQHGVLRAFAPDAALRQRAMEKLEYNGRTLVIHVTSTISRKGTQELIEAWKDVSWGDLWISCNPRYAAEFEAAIDGHPSIKVVHGQSWGTEAYVKFIQQAHFVVQPSRAEGFGLVPLEARACGVPVVMTGTTGHSDQCQPPWDMGTVLIESGKLAPSDDYWGATAPTVTIPAIATALMDAHRCREALFAQALEGAAALRDHWTWARGASEVVAEWTLRYA